MNSIKSNNSIPFFRYLPRSIKFYGLKNEKVAAFVFIILLGINFGSNLFAVKYSQSLIDLNNDILSQDYTRAIKVLINVAAISIGTFMLMSIFSSFYVYAYIRDLRGIPYTFAQCFKGILKNIIRILLLSIIISLAVFTGSFFFIAPGLILYIMFIFANQYLIDQNRSVFNSLKASLSLTNGYKIGIFMTVLLLNLLILIFPSFVEAGSGLLIFTFVSAFISTIFNLIYQRFITLIYFDLEYIRKPKNIDINV